MLIARFLPTRFHGANDDLWGLALLASPFAFGCADQPAARGTALLFGAGAMLYSFVTNDELGPVPVLPVVAHLGLDALAGGILAILPALLRLQGVAAWTLAGFGLFSLIAGFVTELTPRGGAVGRGLV